MSNRLLNCVFCGTFQNVFEAHSTCGSCWDRGTALTDVTCGHEASGVTSIDWLNAIEARIVASGAYLMPRDEFVAARRALWPVGHAAAA